MTRPGQLNELRVETAFDGNRATTSLFIDGVDILELQRPTVRPDGSSYRDGKPNVFRPADPIGLLPPDSRVLLPAAVPCQAMIGVCSCGEAGCASLWLRVRRDGGQVLWEPDPDAPRHSVDRTWRFDLARYLDAVDAGTSTMTWEPRVRLLAREFRRLRDRLFGFPIRNGYNLLTVSAWPGNDQIIVSVAGPTGVSFHSVPVPADQTDKEIIESLWDFDPARFPR
jgi:hypothetical protein